jgi:chromate transport protein ChrA
MRILAIVVYVASIIPIASIVLSLAGIWVLLEDYSVNPAVRHITTGLWLTIAGLTTAAAAILAASLHSAYKKRSVRAFFLVCIASLLSIFTLIEIMVLIGTVSPEDSSTHAEPTSKAGFSPPKTEL